MNQKEIQLLLKGKGFTQSKLARRWRRHRSTISFLIKGELQSQVLRRKLAELLGIPESDLPRRQSDVQ